MLRARRADGVDLLAEDAQRGPAYSCPECQAELILRKGWVRVHHFAHKVVGVCPLDRQSEERLTIKRALGILFGAQADQYEVRVGPVIADLLIGSIAVEVQTSSITLEVWHETTAALNRAGYTVLWVWGRYGLGTIHDEDAGERRIPAPVLRCHWESWGRVYVYTDRLESVHFEKAAPRPTEYGAYYPKRLRILTRRDVIPPLSVQSTKSAKSDLKLMVLDDNWWLRAPF